MKKLFLLFSLILSASTYALEQEYHGYLKSGDGLCSVRIEEQSEVLHRLHFITQDYTVRAVNIELNGSKFTKHEAIFEKVNDEYEELFFGFPLPKTYSITITNLGKGRFGINNTRLVFGVRTFTHKDTCITQY